MSNNPHINEAHPESPMTDTLRVQADQETKAFLVLEQYPDAVVLLDNNWTIVYANFLFRQKFCAGESPIGTNYLSWLDEASVSIIQALKPKLTNGAEHVELSHRVPDGSTVAFQYFFYPLPTGAGDHYIAGISRGTSNSLGTVLEVMQLSLELDKNNKQLQEAQAKLELLAITDQITQLYNRHYFFKVAQHFWEESRRYKLPLTLVMMDIDNFKTINDTHGHLFGDHVLKNVTFRLRKGTRKSDILARFGGEEIVLLAPNTDFQTGVVLAERMILAIGTEPFTMGNCSAAVTASAGISCTDSAEFESFEALLDSSDRALYAAKQAGKNCVRPYSVLAAKPYR